MYHIFRQVWRTVGNLLPFQKSSVAEDWGCSRCLKAIGAINFLLAYVIFSLTLETQNYNTTKVNRIRTYTVEGFVGAVKGHVVCDECEMPLVNVDSVGFEDGANFSHSEKD